MSVRHLCYITCFIYLKGIYKICSCLYVEDILLMAASFILFSFDIRPLLGLFAQGKILIIVCSLYFFIPAELDYNYWRLIRNSLVTLQPTSKIQPQGTVA